MWDQHRPQAERSRGCYLLGKNSIGRLEALVAHGTGEPERASAGRLASIGSKYLSGDERRFFGSKKDGGARDLGWVADAPKRYALGQGGLPLRGCGEAAEHTGLRRTRCHCSYTHAGT